MRKRLLATLVLFTLLTLAYAQEPGLVQLLSRAGFSDPERIAVERFFARAESLGVPHEILLPRLQEGIAKGIPAGRILAALNRDLDHLIAVREIFASIPGAEEYLEYEGRWARAANLLSAGMEREVLASLVRLSLSRPDLFREATVLYVSLQEWGLSKSAILDVVGAALDSELDEEELRGLPELFVLARSRRIRPERTVERLLQALPRAETLRQLRRMVVE